MVGESWVGEYELFQHMIHYIFLDLGDILVPEWQVVPKHVCDELLLVVVPGVVIGAGFLLLQCNL